MTKFKPLRTALTVLACVLVAASARAETWTIDPVHSSIDFSVRHMMLSNVTGEFDKFAGTISANGADPNSLAIDVTIDAASVDTHTEKRDNDLRSPNFLDVAKYPTITFKSTKVEAAGQNRWKVTGDLTLHGVTKPVVLDVTGPTPEVKAMGKIHRAASATTTIDRRDFGLTFNKTLDNGGLVVGNEVTITINVDAAKNPLTDGVEK
jgi:polyisoprenoid-binding protein YceI